MTTCPKCLADLPQPGPCPNCRSYPTDVARRRAAHFTRRAAAAMAAGNLALAAGLAEVAASYDLLVLGQ